MTELEGDLPETCRYDDIGEDRFPVTSVGHDRVGWILAKAVLEKGCGVSTHPLGENKRPWLYALALHLTLAPLSEVSQLHKAANCLLLTRKLFLPNFEGKYVGGSA